MLPYILRRLAAILISFLIITAVLYGILLLSPPEMRARLYMGPNLRPYMTEQQLQNLINSIIDRYGLDDPYPLQYVRWLGLLLRGEWGYSPSVKTDVLRVLVQRTSSTAELILFSLILIIPAGLVAGTVAGWRRGRGFDRAFRGGAYVATSIPPFILGLVLLSLFYVGVRWFPPDRLSANLERVIATTDFKAFTGLLTIDGLLNSRVDITLDALRHLILPAFTLSLGYWATLGRVTRASMIEETGREYLVAAKARGLHDRRLAWRHAFPNASPPALTTVALSAASLVTGVYIVEQIFAMPGLSSLLVQSISPFEIPDIPLVMGVAVYSVIIVLIVMFIFDLLQLLLDPRIRKDILS